MAIFCPSSSAMVGRSRRAVMDYVGRPMILKLETPLGSGEDFDRKVSSFATIFGMDVLALSCDLEVFEHSYDRAKSLSRDHAMERARAEELLALT